MNGRVVVSRYKPGRQQKNDLSLTLRNKKKLISKKLKKHLGKFRGVKWYICAKVRMIKPRPDGNEVATPHFRSICTRSTREDSIDDQLDESISKVKSSFLEFQRDGSGWLLDEVGL